MSGNGSDSQSYMDFALEKEIRNFAIKNAENSYVLQITDCCEALKDKNEDRNGLVKVGSTEEILEQGNMNRIIVKSCEPT